ncbi:ATP-binding protein [Noviherbaspirillum sp.]|jgi:PAS domain S-box-containing protein|uniref:ATP-binding protein n=1 Tax=Noviherbaspirillum sp. TaxID=1926288 RepID=UPI0025E3FA7C|nr:ATP-binding protein [Noviherbaspirillum sp.]
MGEHLVQFYDDEAFLVEEIWGFIGPCLHAGNVAVVIASKPRLDSLERKFSPGLVPGSAFKSACDQYFSLDAQETLSRIMIDGWPDDILFKEVLGEVMKRASKQGKRHVHAYGEMVALLCTEGRQDAAIRLEQLWTDLAREYPFSLLCGYPMNVFSSEEHSKTFTAICDAHTHVQPAEGFRLPANEDELHRAIATLQQKSNALESEVARRKETEHALQRREQELSDFLENALEGMHRVGPDGTILWANRTELELLGYAPEEFIGHHIAEFHADREAIDDICSKLRSGETLYDYPARMRCKDGSIKHVLMRSNALVLDGEFVSTRCLMRDVTDRVRLEEELARKLHELADIDRRKDEFLAMLGHELRNPLAPIMNSLELMRIYGTDMTLVARSRETIARQVSILTRLVDDLLDVSRITRGKITLKMERISLDFVVERAVEIARPLINERRHHLTINLPADPVYLHGDSARMAQVLANLLHNAAKYTDTGGCISFSARNEGDTLRLSVSDNGIGIAPDLREKVFDLFVQDVASLPKARGGLGLGLTLVRSLVQLHGGTVRAHSEGYGRGSEFVVTLPLRSTTTSRIAPQPTASIDHQMRNSQPRTILIVDDNIDAAESLSEFLKVTGHNVHVANDGLSAIDKAEKLRPDVVILDIGMPAMDGYQVAQYLRTKGGLTSSLLIAVTGYAQERDRISAQKAGFDHHFAKPLDISKLTEILAPDCSRQ